MQGLINNALAASFLARHEPVVDTVPRAMDEFVSDNSTNEPVSVTAPNFWEEMIFFLIHVIILLLIFTDLILFFIALTYLIFVSVFF